MNTDPVMGNMLLLAEGDRWKRLRAIITPTFSAAKLKRMKLCVDDTIKTMIKNMENLLKER